MFALSRILIIALRLDAILFPTVPDDCSPYQGARMSKQYRMNSLSTRIASLLAIPCLCVAAAIAQTPAPQISPAPQTPPPSQTTPPEQSPPQVPGTPQSESPGTEKQITPQEAKQ